MNLKNLRVTIPNAVELREETNKATNIEVKLQELVQKINEEINCSKNRGCYYAEYKYYGDWRTISDIISIIKELYTNKGFRVIYEDYRTVPNVKFDISWDNK